MKRAAKKAGALAGAALFVAGLGLGPEGLRLEVPEARAIIGAPLTPMSYAGVARRTTRRAAYAAAAVSYPVTYPVAVPSAPPPPPPNAALASLPPGCQTVHSGGGVRYLCNNVLYRPVYDGPNVVYIPE